MTSEQQQCLTGSIFLDLPQCTTKVGTAAGVMEPSWSCLLPDGCGDLNTGAMPSSGDRETEWNSSITQCWQILEWTKRSTLQAILFYGPQICWHGLMMSYSLWRAQWRISPKGASRRVEANTGGHPTMCGGYLGSTQLIMSWYSPNFGHDPPLCYYCLTIASAWLMVD